MAILFVAYWTAVAGLCLYGVNCYVLAWLFRRGRADNLARLERVRREYWARADEATLPAVTVQLPVYNERFVVRRLIDAACALDWPAERLEIQVLDDSTDDTTRLAAERVEHHARAGVAITHLRRTDRAGFKAGALRDGLAAARGELVAIFDADFVPPPDYLRRTVPAFSDPRVGLAQARWGHLNDGESFLTRTQAIAIDGHFSVEQAGRCWSGLMLNFNGTAGVWRRRAIEDAGGWQADTLTEDLDLSYRAQLAGWRIEYMLDVEVPAEIPASIGAFKSQQRRWAKGSIQTAKKLLGRVLRADLPVFEKVQAVLHLTHYMVHPLMLAVALLALPLLLLWGGATSPLPFALMALLLALGTCGPTTLYVTAQRALRRDWARRVLRLPGLMVLGTGIAVSNGRAVLEALLGVGGSFVRTPKRGESGRTAADDRSAEEGGYRLPLDWLTAAEAFMAAWAAAGLVVYAARGRWLIGPFLALYAIGFGYVAVRSAYEELAARAAVTVGGRRASNEASAPLTEARS